MLLAAGKSKTEVIADLVLGEGTLPGLQRAAFPLRAHLSWGEGALVSCFS